VYAFESLEEAGDSLESIDLEAPRSLPGAYADRGEIVDMIGGNLYIQFRATGQFDRKGLTELMRGGRGP
jgi:hypothetical protein